MTVDVQGALTLLGAGKMGTALLSGWLSGSLPKHQLQIVEPNPSAKIIELANSFLLPLNPEPAPSAVLILAVKPQMIGEVLADAGGFINEQTLIVSIAAGFTLGSLSQHLPPSSAIIRTMPNTPAEIGMGITIACANDKVTADQKSLCDQLLSAVGEVDWVEDEKLMDAVTAVSGSGPAYIFHFAECLTRAAIDAGLDARLAEKLARVTISGAGALLHQSDLDASTLRENVTSPGGTTAAALEILMSDEGMEDILNKAVRAAKKRSEELSS